MREAGANKWNEFCEWAAGQLAMAPRGQLQYNDDEVWEQRPDPGWDDLHIGISRHRLDSLNTSTDFL